MQHSNIYENLSYSELLILPEWKNKRISILKRDNNRCRCCNSINNLEVHHRQYHISNSTQKKKLPWEYDANYLITLCESCHKKGHILYKIKTYIINK